MTARIAYLHGFLGDPTVWDAIAPPGAVVPVLPGHRGSAVAPTWAANVDAIANAIGGCDVVVGYSLGARIALGLRAAGHVPAAVLIGVNPGLDVDARAARRQADALWAELVRARGVAAFVDAWQQQPLFASQARVPQDARDQRRARRLAHAAEPLARCLEVMGLAEMPDYRDAVDARCALIVGAHDAKFLELARGLPAPLRVIEDSGHDPTLEQPAALRDAIGDAIAGLS